jgi:hypothetical protein
MLLPFQHRVVKVSQMFGYAVVADEGRYRNDGSSTR